MAKLIRTETTINAPIHMVWQILTEFESYNEWNPFLKNVSADFRSGGKVKFSAIVRGRKLKFAAKFNRVEELSYFAWSGDDAPISFAVNGNHYFELKKLDEKRTLFIHGENFTGLIIPAISFLLNQAQPAYESMNLALKERAENLCQDHKENKENSSIESG